MLLPLIRLPPLSILVGIFAAGTAYYSTNQLMSAATQLHSRMAEYFVEYRYPASYLDCLREELSQFIYHYIYHYITFITLNKTKTKTEILHVLHLLYTTSSSDCIKTDVKQIILMFRLPQTDIRKKSITHHSDVQIASD